MRVGPFTRYDQREGFVPNVEEYFMQAIALAASVIHHIIVVIFTTSAPGMT
jgi:hypothetical protein